MTQREDVSSKASAAFLMDISAALANHTQRAEDFQRIPAFLARALNVDPITTAVIRTVADGAMVLLGAHSEAPPPATMEQDLLFIHQQLGPIQMAGESAVSYSSPYSPTSFPPIPQPILQPVAMCLEHLESDMPTVYPMAHVWAHDLDDRHRLLVVIHRRADDPPISEELGELLELVGRQLGILLECLILWLTRPRNLGEPFNLLTDREWMVLRGLNTDASEKQLADQLGISPHTLHAHIKSIFRKVGARGRLPLLHRVEETLRDLRRRKLDGHLVPMVSAGEVE